MLREFLTNSSDIRNIQVSEKVFYLRRTDDTAFLMRFSDVYILINASGIASKCQK